MIEGILALGLVIAFGWGIFNHIQIGLLIGWADRVRNILNDQFPVARVEVIKGKLCKSTLDAACWDVHSDMDVTIYPGETKIVPTGLITEMFDCDAFLFDRSGLAAKFCMTRRAGVIDEKYPEEWGVIMVNEGRLPYHVKKGDRIAQALFVPKTWVDVECRSGGTGIVTVSGETRTSGFGSTGK